MEDKTWIASFDIGKANFAFYIEEIDVNELEKLKNIPCIERYNDNGTVTSRMGDLLSEVYKIGKTILFINEDLTKGTDKNKYLDVDIYYNMNNHLDKYISYFEKCSFILIERQLKRNTMAMKLGQHCFSYFTIKLQRSIHIIEFQPYFKTQILGAEKTFEKQYKNGNIKWKTMDQRCRKKWAVLKGTDILKLKGEQDILKRMETDTTKTETETTKRGKKKKIKLDDILDNKLMIEAFKYMYFVDKVKF